MIHGVILDNAEAICNIYSHYIEETLVTFEEESVSIEKMQCRINDEAGSFPWLVFESDGDILGYAYASRWKGRCAYRYSVESTVYLAPDVTGRGIGSQLYDALLPILRDRAIHSLIGGIALSNPAIINLHEKMGFKRVAHFKEIGWKFKKWIDVGYWKLIFCNTKQSVTVEADKLCH